MKTLLAFRRSLRKTLFIALLIGQQLGEESALSATIYD